MLPALKILQTRDPRFELCYSPSSKYDDVISALQSVSSVILFKSLEINYEWINELKESSRFRFLERW